MPTYTAIITIRAHSKYAARAYLNSNEDIIVQDLYEEQELEENDPPYNDLDTNLIYEYNNYPGHPI